MKEGGGGKGACYACIGWGVWGGVRTRHGRGRGGGGEESGRKCR